MPLFTYQGTTWNSIKGLFFSSASTVWSNAKSGWVYDGTNWKIAYPSFPINTVVPVLTGIVAYSNTITVNTGTWDTTAVVNPTLAYSYQWLRDGVAIADTPVGTSTTSSYVCQSGDVGKQLSCRVTANNDRGGTPAITASQLVVPKLTIAPKYTDTTPTPSSVSNFATAQGINPYDWKITSWTTGTNTTAFELTQTVATGASITYTSPNTNATGNSAGTNPAVVTVKSLNTSCKVTIDTFTTIGANGYRIKLDSEAEVLLGSTATTYEFTGVSVGSHTVTVVPYFNSSPGVGNSVNFTTVSKSNSAQTSITVKELGKIPTVTVVNGTATPGGISGATLTEGADQSWSAAWTNGGSTTVTTVSTGTASGSPATSASGTASDGSVSVDITPYNTSKVLTASWAAQTGATKYLARIDSEVEIDLGNVTSADYSVGDTSNHTITVTPYANDYRGQSTQSAAVAAANVVGTSKNVTGSWTVVNTVSPSGLISLNGNNFTWTTSGAAQGSYSISGSNLALPSGGTVQTRGISNLGYSTSYTWTVTAYKSSNRTGGSTSKSTTFNTLYNPGTPILSSTSTTGTGTTYRAFVQWSAPTVTATLGAATSYRIYASQSASSNGPWVALNPSFEDKTVFSTTRQGTVASTVWIRYEIYAKNDAGFGPALIVLV